jgi:hypothetical protein
MLVLSDKWGPILRAQPETGMSYQIAVVTLKDGRKFERVTIVGGIIADVDGNKEIPFTEDQIADIHVP